MAAHEFGLLPEHPLPGQRFDAYEPERYHCLRVADELIEPLMSDTLALDCFWHTLDCPAKGLNYAGITLIPPEAMEAFLLLLQGDALAPLRCLAVRAQKENRFLIHYGL